MLRNTFYITSLLLMILWIAGFFFMNAGLPIHILAVFAVIFYLQAVIMRPKPKSLE